MGRLLGHALTTHGPLCHYTRFGISVAVREHKGEIVFLRRVVPGGANKSYGIDVARLAGLPKSVITRARTVMSQLETSSDSITQASSPQLSLLQGASPPASPLLGRLQALGVDRTTPLEALQVAALSVGREEIDLRRALVLERAHVENQIAAPRLCSRVLRGCSRVSSRRAAEREWTTSCRGCF